MQIFIFTFKFGSLLAQVTLFSKYEGAFPLLATKLGELRCKHLRAKQNHFKAQRLSAPFSHALSLAGKM